MRFSTLALYSALVIAAASTHVCGADEASSSSSLPSSLLARSDAVAASSSSLVANSSLQKRVDEDVSEVDQDEGDYGDDSDDADDDSATSDDSLESRGKKHHKHKKPHRKHHHHHRSKKHSKVSHPTSSNGTFRGKGTFFKPNQGACGKWNTVNDKIVALSSDIYKGGHHCFKGVRICHGAKCANAKVADLCPGCKHTSLDMSPSLFKELASPSVGVIDIQWSFT